MRELYRHVDLDDNDEVQYSYFYPKTNKIKHINPYESEVHTIPTKELPEFRRLYRKIEPNDKVSDTFYDYSENPTGDKYTTSMRVRHHTFKQIDPFPYLLFKIMTTTIKGRVAIERKMNLQQAIGIRDIINKFIEENTK